MGSPLAREGGLYLDICAGDPRVPSYAIADGAGLPILSKSRFEEPVRPWSTLLVVIAVFSDMSPVDAENAFNREAFGRQSMSEKRKAYMDARLLNFCQQAKSVRGINVPLIYDNFFFGR